MAETDNGRCPKRRYNLAREVSVILPGKSSMNKLEFGIPVIHDTTEDRLCLESAGGETQTGYTKGPPAGCFFSPTQDIPQMVDSSGGVSASSLATKQWGIESELKFSETAICTHEISGKILGAERETESTGADGASKASRSTPGFCTGKGNGTAERKRDPVDITQRSKGGSGLDVAKGSMDDTTDSEFPGLHEYIAAFIKANRKCNKGMGSSSRACQNYDLPDKGNPSDPLLVSKNESRKKTGRRLYASIAKTETSDIKESENPKRRRELVPVIDVKVANSQTSQNQLKKKNCAARVAARNSFIASSVTESSNRWVCSAI